MEGPTCFKMNDENRWCLFLDDFGGKGYFPMMTENLSGGGFSESNKNDYSLPSVMRHGSVINITKEEYYALLNKFDDGYQTVFRVNPAERQQQVEGWGISLCWWANMCGKWSDDKVNDLVELLTSEDGLNYNIFRYNIGGGDAPSHYNGHMCSGKGKRAEMEGFKSSANSEYDWNADSGQRNILMKIKQKRPDAIFEAFSNSPPYWMTYSGCSAGNSDGNKDNLKPEYYGAFCDYLIDVCRHFKSAYNIEFKTLEPFNEPNTNYWSANGGQEGCHFDVASQINLLRVLSPKLKKSGLNTVISACDETSVTTAINELKSYGKESDIIPLLGQFNVHTYSGNPIDKVNLSDLVHEAKLPFWMSESGEGGSGLSGNLKMAQRMFDDVNYLMPSAWIDWQFMEEGNDQWCFVSGNFSQQKYSIVKNYYVRMQVTRFIKAGYSILTTGRDDVMAAISPDGEKVVVVMLNKEKHEKLVKVDLSLLKDYGETAELYVTNSRLNCSREQDLPIEGNQLVYEMGAEEISTILISMKGANPVASLLDNQPYLVLPRASSTVMTMMTEGPKLSYFCDSDTSQRWYFQHVSNDVYVIYTTKDERRYALTDDGSYYLKMNEMNIGDERQHFKIIRIAENCYKIISVTDDKWMDLEGAALVSGTKIGLWKNDEVGSNGHREWRILSFPFSMSDSDETVNDDVENGGVLIYYRDNRVTVVNALKSEIQIDIVDMNGRTVVNKRTNEERSEFTLSDGLYVVRCTGGKKTASKVLVW